VGVEVVAAVRVEVMAADRVEEVGKPQQGLQGDIGLAIQRATVLLLWNHQRVRSTTAR